MLDADGERCGGGRGLEPGGEVLAGAPCSAEAGSRCAPASCSLELGECEESILHSDVANVTSCATGRDRRGPTYGTAGAGPLIVAPVVYPHANPDVSELLVARHLAANGISGRQDIYIPT